MNPPPASPEKPFDRLCRIMDELLAPGGCPWDREQTHESLMQYLIEESYEVCESIENEDWDHLKEELGDVALQVVFHAALARAAGRFSIDDVCDAISEKLIRRHPHVFADAQVDGSGQVLENWERIKQGERREKKTDESLLAGMPRSLPALQKALRMQSKVARVGFDWKDEGPVLDKVREEFEELAGARRKEVCEGEVFEETGDLLFAMVNAARHMGVQPEEALQAACRKFEERFRYIEDRAQSEGKDLQSMSLEEMERYWEEAKKKTPKE